MPILDAQTLQTLEFRSMVRTNESEEEKKKNSNIRKNEIYNT